MEKKDPLRDPSLSEMEFAELSRKLRDEEAEMLREELRGVDSDIKVKCDYLRNNPEKCTLEALQALMDIINSKDYTFAGSEDARGGVVASCHKDDSRKMVVDGTLSNILWVVKTHYLLAKARREREEIEEFVSKLPIAKKDEDQAAIGVDLGAVTEVEESEGNDDLGRDPMRWLFFELRRRGYIKNGDDAFMLRNLSELTGHSYKQIYKNKNEELTDLAKRRMIAFFEELIEKLNK